MKGFYWIAVCLNVAISVSYLLLKDYSAARETLITAMLFAVLANQVKGVDR